MMVETFMRQPLFDKLYSKRQAFISIACMRYVGDVLIKASLCESWVGPFWYMGLFFKHHPSCMSCTSHFRRAALAGSAPRGSWLVKAHHHSGRAPHVGAPTKHGISCPIVGACTWQARYGYVNIIHADICVCFHALRVHHRFRRAALPGRPLRRPRSGRFLQAEGCSKRCCQFESVAAVRRI